MQTILSGIPAMLYPINFIDIIIIAFVLYKIMAMIRGTRAAQLAKGMLILLAFSAVSDIIGLSTVNWVLVQVQKMLIVAIPIVFAPEMRRALEHLGKGRIFRQTRSLDAKELVESRIDRIVGCLRAASSTRTGVLIVIARDSSLQEYISTGIAIHGNLSTALLNNIFIVNTPMHDGAVIIDGDEIVAASCYLPLSESRTISKALGTRHRAAIGLSEVSDAVIAVVSEETGSISVAMNSHLSYDLSLKDLNTILMDALYTPEEQLSFWQKWRRKI